MGHSIRSKKKRAFRAVKRVRYGIKERATLVKMLETGNLNKYVEEYQKTKEVPVEGAEPKKQQGRMLIKLEYVHICSLYTQCDSGLVVY